MLLRIWCKRVAPSPAAAAISHIASPLRAEATAVGDRPVPASPGGKPKSGQLPRCGVACAPAGRGLSRGLPDGPQQVSTAPGDPTGGLFSIETVWASEDRNGG